MRLAVNQLTTHQIGPLDLQLDAGECVFVYGPSGAGKSLFLRALADLDPHQGEITLDNQLQQKIPPSQWRKTVAYLPAESHWWEERVDAHFLQIDLPSWQQLGFDQTSLAWQVDLCSSGERQRLAILRLLQHQPQILLLDEPTANLDPRNVDRVEELILRYQQQHNAAVLWVSHDFQQIERLATQTLHMEAGKWSQAK